MPRISKGSRSVAHIMGAADAAIGHDVARSRQLLEADRDVNPDCARRHRVWLAASEFPVRAVRAVRGGGRLEIGTRGYRSSPGDAGEPQGLAERAFLPAQAWPWLALAEAKTGDVNAARREIAKTPLDCYLCLRVRGQIDSLEKNWNGAAYWFARAVAAAPSISLCLCRLGRRCCSRKGDLDGAIAKFESAHAKGPHFADPLEMWGEALIAKNRSDLALAKFEEANKYAPNWGRLHLKWGEALSYLGKKDDAAKQFALARSLHD